MEIISYNLEQFIIQKIVVEDNWQEKLERIKDKWKEKKWVNVIAPDSFNNVNIGYVPITDDENAKGRILEVTLWDILKGDPSQHQYKIIFQIDNVTDNKAKTIFKRYEYSKEFLRSLIRRGSSKVNFIIDAENKRQLCI